MRSTLEIIVAKTLSADKDKKQKRDRSLMLSEVNSLTIKIIHLLHENDRLTITCLSTFEHGSQISLYKLLSLMYNPMCLYRYKITKWSFVRIALIMIIIYQTFVDSHTKSGQSWMVGFLYYNLGRKCVFIPEFTMRSQKPKRCE